MSVKRRLTIALAAGGCLALAVGGCSGALQAEKPIAEPAGLVYDETVTSKATGFFRVERDEKGVWRFVTPGGHGFFMAANNGPQRASGDYCKALGYDPFGRTIKAKYADTAAWAAEAVRRLRSWNFNAITAWLAPLTPELHDKGLAWTMVVHFGKSFPGVKDVADANLLAGVNGGKIKFPNVFSAAYPEHCRQMAQKLCAPYRDDPTLVGWFIDNEIRWNGPVSWNEADREGVGLYNGVAALPAGHSARVALDAFLAKRGLKAADAVEPAVKREFLRLIARRYFEVTIAALKAVDPNHAVLGCRFAGANTMCDVVWEEAGRACDAVSVNWYPTAEPETNYVRANWRHHAPSWEERMAELVALTRKPLIISEWAYRGGDTGHKNSKGAGQRCPTQTMRAQCSALFASKMIGHYAVIGYSHFKYVDEPVLGRFDGEDCNYGLVNEKDEPYRELTAALTRVQSELYRRRPTVGDFSNEKGK